MKVALTDVEGFIQFIEDTNINRKKKAEEGQVHFLCIQA